jgi:hypothetical protein
MPGSTFVNTICNVDSPQKSRCWRNRNRVSRKAKGQHTPSIFVNKMEVIIENAPNQEDIIMRDPYLGSRWTRRESEYLAMQEDLAQIPWILEPCANTWRTDSTSDIDSYRDCAHTITPQLDKAFYSGWIPEISHPTERKNRHVVPKNTWTQWICIQGKSAGPADMDTDEIQEPLHEKCPHMEKGDTRYGEHQHSFTRQGILFGKTAGISTIFENTANLSWHDPPKLWYVENGPDRPPVPLENSSYAHQQLLREVGADWEEVLYDNNFHIDRSAEILMRNWLGYFLTTMETRENTEEATTDVQVTPLLYYTIKVAGMKISAMLDAGSGLETVIGYDTAIKLGLNTQFQLLSNPIRVSTADPKAQPWVCTHLIPLRWEDSRSPQNVTCYQ